MEYSFKKNKIHWVCNLWFGFGQFILSFVTMDGKHVWMAILYCVTWCIQFNTLLIDTLDALKRLFFLRRREEEMVSYGMSQE